MDKPHNNKVKLQFNAKEFIKNATSYCRCGVKDYQQDLLLLRLIQKYINYKVKSFYYYPNTTSIKYRNIPHEYVSVLDEICDAICTVLPYVKAQKHIDDNGMHMILRMPYRDGVFHDGRLRFYHFKDNHYSIGTAVSAV